MTLNIIRFVILTASLVLTLAASSPASAAASRDVLWDIVSNCLDPGAADYCTKCRWPRPGTTCAEELICKHTTEVWAETDAYVVLRDRKMCGCPKDFVHALAIPRTRVTGVDDPDRPEGIWAFAWGVAMEKIGPGPDAALAVNPVATRAQDQLHVHIVRLQKDARQRFCRAHVTQVRDLDSVWKTAAKSAAAAGLSDYGVLVTSNPAGGFLVVVGKESPEKEYVMERCK